MIKKHIVFIVCSVIFVSLFALPATVIAQEQTMTREERIKTLELLKMEDSKWENAATGQTMKELQLEIEKMELPPLSVFFGCCIRKCNSEESAVTNCPS